MSYFYGYAINPLNGLEERVCVMSDYFGESEAGVRFCDGKVYEIDKVKISGDEDDDQ
jgi:hypothetical protein